METLKKFKKLFFMLIMVFSILNMSNYLLAQEPENRIFLKIYYIPSYIQHFTNTTMDMIENQSHLTIWIYDNDSLVSEITGLLKGEKPSKETQNIAVGHLDIHLKIENVKDGNIYFMDPSGIVITNKGDRFVLSRAQTEKLEETIVKLRGIIRVKVDKLEDQLSPKSAARVNRVNRTPSGGRG